MRKTIIYDWCKLITCNLHPLTGSSSRLTPGTLCMTNPRTERNKPAPLPSQVQEKAKCFGEWLGQSHWGTRVFSGVTYRLHCTWHGRWQGQGRKYTNSRPNKVQILPSHCVNGESHGPSSEPNLHFICAVYFHVSCTTTKSCQETNFFLLKMINKTHIGMENMASVDPFCMLTEHSIRSAASEWQAGGGWWW